MNTPALQFDVDAQVFEHVREQFEFHLRQIIPPMPTQVLIKMWTPAGYVIRPQIDTNIITSVRIQIENQLRIHI